MTNQAVFKRVTNLAGAGIVLLSLLFTTAPVYAASASVYLSPSGSTVAKGSSLYVSVRENSGGEPVNAAQINLSYPTNLLSFVSISSSSAFGIVAQNSGGGGSVQIGRGALPAVSGTQTIATVRFKALADSGRATVSIKAGSSVISANSNSNIATGLSGGSYTLTKPAVAPPPPPKDTTPPKITSVKTSDVTFSSVVISWTTSEPASSTVDYGTSKSYGLSASDSALVTAHKVKLSSPLIIPAQQYHYLVKSADASGNSASGADGTFTTEGANVAVTVTDQNNKAVKGAKVTLLDSSATTDDKGHALIKGATVGRQTLVVEYKGHTYAQVITVNPPDAKNTAQAVKSSITTKSGLIWPLVLCLILLAIIVWLIKRGGGFGPMIAEVKSLRPGSKDKMPVAGASLSPEPAIIRPTKKDA